MKKTVLSILIGALALFIANSAMAFTPPPSCNITGPTSVHTGHTATGIGISGGASSGTWTSSSTTIATVNPTTGAVTGIRPGTITLGFTGTSGCGTITRTETFTVSCDPALAATYTVSGTSVTIGAINGSGDYSGTGTFTQTTTSHLYTITDNISTCTASVTVTVALPPCTPPTVTCSGNISTNNDTGVCGAAVTYTAATTTGTTPTVSYSATSGSTFSVGTTTVTATAMNACGTATCTFTVEVIDNEDPTITAPANITADANNAGCSWKGSLGTPIYGDNCSAIVTNDAPDSFAVGTTTVTWTATDPAGHTATSTQTVTITNPASVSIAGNTNPCLTTGYGASSSTITADGSSTTDVTYLWSTGETTASIDVSPTTTSTVCTTNTYSVTVTDGNGCTASTSATVSTRDVRCYTPSGVQKVNVCHHTGTGETMTLCIDADGVPDHLAHGDELGACGSATCCTSGYARVSHNATSPIDAGDFKVYPSPTNATIKIEIPYSDNSAQVIITDITGRVILKMKVAANTNAPVEFNVANVPNGVYIVKINLDGVTYTDKFVKN